MVTGREAAVRLGSPTVRWVERYWRGEAGAWGRVLDGALAPAEAAFRLAVRLRGAGYDADRLPSARATVPVASVGNLAVGGAGKTPVTRWLVEELRRRGARPGILHGGYAEDEPALHRTWFPGLPVVAGRDRAAGARAAVAAGATVLVLDDGFQHRRLARDLDVALVAAESWVVAPRLLPRGPWREPPTALARADVVAVTRKTAAGDTARRIAREVRRFAPGATMLRLYLRPAGIGRLGAPGETGGIGGTAGPVLAVAGIARPDQFVANAIEAGATVGDALYFPDHHAYTMRDVARIREAARGRPVVTTAKDAVKLATLGAALDLRVLDQEVVVEEGEMAIHALLDELVP